MSELVREMPKIKSSRAAAKRFKITGKGKIKRVKARASHLLSKKSRKNKRKLRRSTLVSAAERKKVKRMLPYG